LRAQGAVGGAARLLELLNAGRYLLERLPQRGNHPLHGALAALEILSRVLLELGRERLERELELLLRGRPARRRPPLVIELRLHAREPGPQDGPGGAAADGETDQEKHELHRHLPLPGR
jgi:hypothetical protein